MTRNASLAALAILLLASSPAQAIYLVTDLEVFADQSSRNVGDTVNFTVGPANESVVADYAGRTLRVVYTFDGAEEGSTVTGDVGTVTLDEAARGAFSWTVPAEAHDKNVFISIMEGEEAVGTTHVAVGDAPPILMATGGPAGSGPIVDDGALDETADESAKRETPGFTALAILGAAGAAVLLLSRRFGR